MSRQRGHLRLIVTDELEAPFSGDGGPPIYEEGEVGHLSQAEKPAVDTRLRFHCRTCGRDRWTDQPIRELWCTGSYLGVREHRPTRMDRNLLSE